MNKLIAISLSPNAQGKDVFLALKLLFSPWLFFQSDGVKSLEAWFRQYFKVSFAISFDSGRGAMLAILKALGVGKEDEVILQAFTCVAVPNAVIAAGAKPVYCDISEALTIDTEDLERKISQKTKAMIIQHTFGIPADLNQIIKIAKKYKLHVIEDCAHTVGVKQLGTYGIASFFSFGRDKAFSSVAGGIAITDNKLVGKKIRSFQKQLATPSFFWIIQQLLHPLAFYFILPFYETFSLGKIILIALQKVRLLSFPVVAEEKDGKAPSVKKFTNALAYLALFQLRRINEFNKRREEISSVYLRDLNQHDFIAPYKKVIPFLRFPVLYEDRENLMRFLRKKRIYAGKWYSEVIDPKGVNFNNIFYQKGACPKAEYIASRIINLPTYPKMGISDAMEISSCLKEYVKNKRNI